VRLSSVVIVATVTVGSPVRVAIDETKGRRIAILVVILLVADLGVPRISVRVGVVTVVTVALHRLMTVAVPVGAILAPSQTAVLLFTANRVLGAGRVAHQTTELVGLSRLAVAGLHTVAEQSIVAVGIGLTALIPVGVGVAVPVHIPVGISPVRLRIRRLGARNDQAEPDAD